MVMHPMLNVDWLKLYEPSMLNENEEEFITPIPEDIIVDVGAELEDKTVLPCKKNVTIHGTLEL